MKRRAQWPGDQVVKWQSDEDGKVLDPRTAAVLALGELVLARFKENPGEPRVTVDLHQGRELFDAVIADRAP